MLLRYADDVDYALDAAKITLMPPLPRRDEARADATPVTVTCAPRERC